MRFRAMMEDMEKGEGRKREDWLREVSFKGRI